MCFVLTQAVEMPHKTELPVSISLLVHPHSASPVGLWLTNERGRTEGTGQMGYPLSLASCSIVRRENGSYREIT